MAPVQTGLDQLEVLRLLDNNDDEAVVTHREQLTGGQLSGLGQGRWCLRLAQPVRVNALFTGCY